MGSGPIISGNVRTNKKKSSVYILPRTERVPWWDGLVCMSTYCLAFISVSFVGGFVASRSSSENKCRKRLAILHNSQEDSFLLRKPQRESNEGCRNAAAKQLTQCNTNGFVGGKTLLTADLYLVIRVETHHWKHFNNYESKLLVLSSSPPPHRNGCGFCGKLAWPWILTTIMEENDEMLYSSAKLARRYKMDVHTQLTTCRH